MGTNISKASIAVLGAGSWGTAIAIHLAKSNNKVNLWSHRKDHALDMQKLRENKRYLPGVTFPENLSITSDLKQCTNADTLIIAVPSHAFGDLLNRLPDTCQSIAWLTKGIDMKTNLLLSQLVSQKYDNKLPMAIISGPSFAKEVAIGLPTALTIASNDTKFQEKLQDIFHHQNIRAYLSNDLIGVQVCGAIKNILAIACGISDGLNYGANAKAALITRGLVEMKRLGLAMGAKEQTFNGLAGLGDLILTCTDNQSRNRRFGLYLGQGMAIKEAQDQIDQVVEGRHNAKQVCHIATKLSVEMPICTQVNAILSGQITSEQAVLEIMQRPAGIE